MPYGALVTGQSLQNQHDSLSNPPGEEHRCKAMSLFAMAPWRSRPCPGRPRTEPRARQLGNRGQPLQALHSKSKCQTMEFDPIYETIFFASCCPLLSHAEVARRGLRCSSKAGHCGAQKNGKNPTAEVQPSRQEKLQRNQPQSL